jgi:hypothetical protein
LTVEQINRESFVPVIACIPAAGNRAPIGRNGEGQQFTLLPLTDGGTYDAGELSTLGNIPDLDRFVMRGGDNVAIFCIEGHPYNGRRMIQFILNSKNRLIRGLPTKSKSGIKAYETERDESYECKLVWCHRCRAIAFRK